LEIVKQKARGGFLRPGFVSFRDDVVIPLICPTCQILFRVIGTIAGNDGAPVRPAPSDNKARADEALAWRLSLGGKQKREQPTGRRHRLIRIVGIDARKSSDPAGKTAPARRFDSV
jgi:hypothetical protein